MIRRAAITVLLVLGVLATAPSTPSAYNRLVVSARTFQRHFSDLGGAGHSLSTIERFFFSLALTTTQEPQGQPHPPQRS